MTRVLLTIGLVSSILCSMACVQKGGNAGPGDTGDTIKVGVYGDLTGQTSSFGQSTKNGVELAVEEINAAGGVNGKKIQLLIEDDQGRPEQAKTVVSKLINQDKVQAILGEVASTNSLAAAPVAQEAKIPMITPSSTNPKVTETGDYISRVCFIDPFQGMVIAKFAKDTQHFTKAAIFRDNKNDYSVGLANYFTEAFKGMGGTIVADEAYSEGDQDFKAQLTNIKGKKPEFIFVPGYYTEVGLIARQARGLGITVPLLGCDGWVSDRLLEIAQDALNGSYFVSHYWEKDTNPSIQK